MRVILVLIFFSIWSGLKAQIEFIPLESTGSTGLMDLDYLMELNETSGSPLGFNEWRRGRAVMQNGDTSGYYEINYHTLGDVVYFKNQTTNEFYKTDENNIDWLLLENGSGEVETFKRVLWQSFDKFPEYPKICEVLIEKEDFRLIRYYDKELIEPEDIDPRRLERSDNYRSKIRYYWKDSKNSPYKEIEKLNRFWINQNLSKAKQDAMKDLQKANSFKWSKENDIVEMLKLVF